MMREYMYKYMKKTALCMMVITILSVLSVIACGERTEAAELSGQQAVAVELPQNLNFYLDPDNDYGKGQIYSKKYAVRNLGDEAVVLSMEMMLSIVDPEVLIQFSPNEELDASAERSIYMYAVFEGAQGKEICVLTDPKASCTKNIVLEPAGAAGNVVYISFGGRLSESEDWKSGELTVKAIYDVSENAASDEIKLVGSHIRIEKSADAAAAGGHREFLLVPDDGYYLPSEIQVYEDGVKREALYDALTGKVVLQNVTGTVVVYANGITKASLPDITAFDMEKAVWAWTAEKGVQAYQYAFLQNNETAVSGSVPVENGAVSWNWSEGLADGSYQLCLKAIGDTVYCLDSEEGFYTVTVKSAVLRPSENAGGLQKTEQQEGEKAPDLSNKNDNAENSGSLNGENNPAVSEPSDNADNTANLEPADKADDAIDQKPVDKADNTADMGEPAGKAEQKPVDKADDASDSEQTDKADDVSDSESEDKADDAANPELTDKADNAADSELTDKAENIKKPEPSEENPAEQESADKAENAEKQEQPADKEISADTKPEAENLSGEEAAVDTKDSKEQAQIDDAENLAISEQAEDAENPEAALVSENSEITSMGNGCGNIPGEELFGVSGAGMIAGVWTI